MKANDKMRIKRERALAQIDARIAMWKSEIQKGQAPASVHQIQLQKAEAERAAVQARIESREGKVRKPTQAERDWRRHLRANYAEQESRRYSEMIQNTIDLTEYSC
jgi:hypothetical protein